MNKPLKDWKEEAMEKFRLMSPEKKREVVRRIVRIADPVTRPDLDDKRRLCCETRKDRAKESAVFDDPLRVDCPTCGAKAPHLCVGESESKKTT